MLGAELESDAVRVDGLDGLPSPRFEFKFKFAGKDEAN
jgi:hypothetical protein